MGKGSGGGERGEEGEGRQGRRGLLEQSETMGKEGGMERRRETKVIEEGREREGVIGCRQARDR